MTARPPNSPLFPNRPLSGSSPITAPPVNAPPVANNDSATVAEGGTVTVLDSTAASVLANDTDAEANTLTATKIGRASCRERVQISVVAVSLKKKRRETTTDSFTYKTYDTGTTGSPPVAFPKQRTASAI